jgi:hypothetical protein
MDYGDSDNPDANVPKSLWDRMLNALYGMLISSILYYKKFRKDI